MAAQPTPHMPTWEDEKARAVEMGWEYGPALGCYCWRKHVKGQGIVYAATNGVDLWNREVSQPLWDEYMERKAA